MKTFRLVVATRLAFFPLIFNLIFAGEVEVSTENYEQIFPTPLYQEGQNSQENEKSSSLIKEAYPAELGKDHEVVEDLQNKTDTPMDSSTLSQNDKDIQDSQLFTQLDGAEQASLRSEWQTWWAEPHPYPLLLGEGNHEVVGKVYDEMNEDLQNEGDTPMDSSTLSQNDNDIQDFSLLSQWQNNLRSLWLNNELEISNLPSLIISEVYRLWSYEWIEITNLSDEDFSGKISLSWVKSSLYTKNLSIPAYSSVILADRSDIGLIDTGILIVDNAWFSINDSQEFWISLIYSGTEIDFFTGDLETITNHQVPASQPRPSIQKIYNNGREMQISTNEYICNITWYIANPWKIIIKNWNPWIGDWPSNQFNCSWDGENPGTGGNSWTWNSQWTWNQVWSGDDSWNWGIIWNSSDFNLILSEVFYDDDDEWIEIFNIGSWDFYGDMELSWAIFPNNQTNQIYSDIQIPAQDFLIIADSNDMFANINILQNGINYPEFSISDNEEIQISLVLSWEKVDSFYAHEYRVDKRDDYGVSFHKILTQNWPIVTRSLSNDDVNLSEDTYNSANPWVLYTSADEIVDYWTSPNSPMPTNNSETIDCSNVQSDIITISEIFRWWNRYNPFIELAIHEDIEYEYDWLLLSWNLLTQPLNINLDEETITYDREKLQKNTRLILTTQAWSLTEAGLITIILQPNLKFNNFSWELELYGISGQSRQLLDIVKITTWSLEKSNYHAGYSHSCGDEMDNVKDFSPWFDESALRYFSVTSSYNERVVEVVKYVGWGGGCSCPTKAELCWTDSWNVVQTWGSIQTWNSILSWSAQDSSAEASEWQTWNVVDSSEQAPQNDENIKIVSLEPKSPESITLQSFLSYDIDFNNHNYYLKTSTSTTKKYIDGILYANTIDTFTKNFWFLDAWACVYLYSWDVQIDSYCYSSNKPQNQNETQELQSFNPSDYQISITNINYDPDWSDAWNETITIQSNSPKSLDLSKIKMKVNATNKKISWILEPYSSITLKWNFGFPNSTKDGSDVVIILFYDNHIFSTYTYNPNKPKVEIPDWAVKVYSVIDGDTFRYRKEDWSLQSVRLLGVDAPESNTARYRSTECFWKEAKNYLTNLIKNQYVTLEFDSNSSSSDAYGRMLAYVYLDWKMVNETLIAEWYAKEYTYKTSYTHQSDFKQAEENAKKSSKWLRSASTCWKSIEEEPEAWWIDYEKLLIKISNVIYDPEWTDSWNEIVQLSVNNSEISTVNTIDFSDDFSLTIFPRSEYATWITKSKKLTEFWIFDLSESWNVTLKWNFWLPNNRATCVSLNQWSYTFDTRCYNPNWLLSDEEDVQTWDFLMLPNVKIQFIVPNPSWKDSWKEEISLLRTPSDDFPDYLSSLDLSPDFSLLINWKTKKKLVWNLIPNQNITIKWSFWLPNSASCVSLLYKWGILDEFCYSKASDGVKFNSNNTSVHQIPSEELAIVKKVKLVRQWDKLCISYNKTLFTCKSIPNSTTEKNKKLLSMQNSYISELEKYIKSNYSMIYYNSDLKDYFDLYSDAKKAIKSWTGDFTRGEKNISITDISSLFQTEYKQAAKDFFISEIQSFLPENINSLLSQLENQYKTKLVEKSDLSFLSFAD